MHKSKSDLKNRYLINSISLLECPPIGDVKLHFGPNLTIISGENGSGKSSMVSALFLKKWPFGGNVTVNDQGDRTNFEKLPSICILDESSFFEKNNTLKSHDNWINLAKDNPKILEIATHTYNQLVASKFSNREFKINVNNNNQPVVITKQLTYINLAAGEQLILNLAGVLAAREFLNVNCPLIIDSITSILDTNLLLSVITILQLSEDQILYFCNPYQLQSIMELLPKRNKNFDLISL